MFESRCKMTQRSRFTRALAIALALLLALMEPALAAVGTTPTLPPPGNVGISKQEQIQVGQKAVGEVYKQMPVLTDSSPVTQYVQQLGQKLARVIPQQDSWPFQFHVIEQKEINAFALPGGPMFVNVGTINAADNEAELAGVMAHEMAHVYMQHSAKQMKQNVGPSILAGLGQVLGSMIGGVGGAIAAMGGQISGGLWSMKYSRADEAQADAVGAIIMYKAGYNPMYMAEFFQKLEKEAAGTGGAGPQFLSDHPNPGNRVQAVQQEIKNWPSQNYQNTTAQFASAKQQAQKVPAYTAQQIDQMAKSGQIHNQIPAGVPTTSTPAGGVPAGTSPAIANVSMQQVKPSSQFRPYIHGFTIDYPTNWQVQQMQDLGTVIGPSAGMAQGAVAYGAVANLANPQNMSLQQATQALVQQLQQSGLQPVGNATAINVNGQQGYSVDLMGPSPIQGSNGQPLQEHDWLVTFQRPDNSMLYIVFVAPDRDFQQLRPTYQKMLKTLRLQ